MATYNKYDVFVLDLGKGVHQLHALGHTLRIDLTNTTPNPATHAVKADSAGITVQNGYTEADIQNDYTLVGTGPAVGTLTGVNVVYTGTGAGFGPFRYVRLYNDTPTSPADPLIGWWDYGSSISVAVGETFTVEFGTSVFTVT